MRNLESLESFINAVEEITAGTTHPTEHRPQSKANPKSRSISISHEATPSLHLLVQKTEAIRLMTKT